MDGSIKILEGMSETNMREGTLCIGTYLACEIALRLKVAMPEPAGLKSGQLEQRDYHKIYNQATDLMLQEPPVPKAIGDAVLEGLASSLRAPRH